MSKKKKRKQKRKNRQSQKNMNSSPENLEEYIRKCIRDGKARKALDGSKKYIKNHDRKTGEHLLAGSYQLRIKQLLDSGLSKEAGELAKIASQRCQAFADDFNNLFITARGKESDIDQLLSLLEKSATPEQIKNVERQIALNLEHPEIILKSTHLDENHPLKIQAKLILDAWRAVIKGDTSPEVTEHLKRIPRSSPLIYWKLFIRGISAFYKNEDEKALKNLMKIPRESHLHDAAEVIRSTLDRDFLQNNISQWSYRMHDFGRKIAGESFFLRHDLKRIDAALDNCKWRNAINGFNSIASRMSDDPFIEYLLNDLRILFIIFATPMNVNSERAVAWLGVKSDFHAKRIMAIVDSIYFVPEGISGWENILKEHGEDLTSAEKALIYYHLASLVLDILEGRFDDLIDEEKSVMENYNAEHYLRKSLDEEPFPDVYYDLYMYYLVEHDNRKKAEEVLLEWHESFPDDLDALLSLSERAFKRGAFQKALKWADVAEKVNPVHTGVRRLRIMLLFFKASRHLRKRKFHLLQKDLEALRKIPDDKLNLFIESYNIASDIIKKDARPNFESIHSEVSRSQAIIRILAIRNLLINIKFRFEFDPYLNKELSVSPTKELPGAYLQFAELFDSLKHDRQIDEDIRIPLLDSLDEDVEEDILLCYSDPSAKDESIPDNVRDKAQRLGVKKRGEELPLFLAYRAIKHFSPVLSFWKNMSLKKNKRGEECGACALQLAKEKGRESLVKKIEIILGKYYDMMNLWDLADQLIPQKIESIIAREAGEKKKKSKKAKKAKKMNNSSDGQLEIPFEN